MRKWTWKARLILRLRDNVQVTRPRTTSQRAGDPGCHHCRENGVTSGRAIPVPLMTPHQSPDCHAQTPHAHRPWPGRASNSPTLKTLNFHQLRLGVSSVTIQANRISRQLMSRRRMLHKTVRIPKQKHRLPYSPRSWLNFLFISKTCLFNLLCNHQRLLNRLALPITSCLSRPIARSTPLSYQDYHLRLYQPNLPYRPSNVNEVSASSYPRPRSPPYLSPTTTMSGPIGSATRISPSSLNPISPAISIWQLANSFVPTGNWRAATT